MISAFSLTLLEVSNDDMNHDLSRGTCMIPIPDPNANPLLRNPDHQVS